MYWEMSSRPTRKPRLAPSSLVLLGSQTAVISRFWFGPGTTEMLRATAWPRRVPLQRRWRFTYGTVAVYSVGLVTLILIASVRADLVVFRIWRAPILGLNLLTGDLLEPPEIAIDPNELIISIFYFSKKKRKEKATVHVNVEKKRENERAWTTNA